MSPTLLAARQSKGLRVLQSIDSREVDQFDNGKAIYSVPLNDVQVIASFRAICTTEKYLASEVFPQLASLREYPRRSDIWEISRFGVLPSTKYLQTAELLYGLMFKFALDRQARALVAVTDLAHERNLRRYGIRTRRYGPPIEIKVRKGKPSIQLVTGEIPLDVQFGSSFARLIDLANTVDFHDQTSVFGHTRVSA
jgi:acyl homoserine lactone synthase